MPYASAQDLADIYGTDRIAMLAPDTARIERALETASDLIDGYISQRYSLPLSQPSGVLRDCCVSIAVYRMASDPTQLTEDMRKRYEDAVSFLKDVAKGISALGSIPTTAQAQAVLAGTAPAATASPQAVIVDADPRIFSRRTLRRL